jgi:hypothetical protein
MHAASAFPGSRARTGYPHRTLVVVATALAVALSLGVLPVTRTMAWRLAAMALVAGASLIAWVSYIDAFLNQRILPAVSRELLARMAAGSVPAGIRLSMATEGNLTIDFIGRNDQQDDSSVTLYGQVPAADVAI